MYLVFIEVYFSRDYPLVFFNTNYLANAILVPILCFVLADGEMRQIFLLVG